MLFLQQLEKNKFSTSPPSTMRGTPGRI